MSKWTSYLLTGKNAPSSSNNGNNGAPPSQEDAPKQTEKKNSSSWNTYLLTGKNPPKKQTPAESSKLEDFGNSNPLSAAVQSLTNQRDTIANQKYSDPMSQFMQKRGVTELDTAIQNQSQKERWDAARKDLVTDTLLSPIGQNNTVPMRAFTPVAEYNPLSEGPADILSRLASSGEGKVNEAKHNHANAVASAQGQYDRSLRAIAEAERKLPQLDQQIEDVTNRVGMATDPTEAQRLSSQLADLKKQREEYEKAIPSAEDTIYRLVTPKEEIDRSDEAFAAHQAQTKSQQQQLNQILSDINELRDQSSWVTDPDQGERIGEEIEALKAQAHRMLLDNPELVNSSDEALGQSVFSAAAKGANQVASGFSDLLQMVFGDFAQEIWNMVGLDSHDNPITWLNKGVHDDAQKLQEYYAPEVRGNRAAEIVDKYGTTIMAALPAAAMAYATAGGSMATTESLMFASDIAELSGGAQTIAQVGNAVREMSTSPNFLMSFAQEAGSSYNEALEDGMSETDATVYSMMYGYLAALVEVGGTSEVGGLQQYVDELAEGKKGAIDGIKDYVKSILAEGDEEKLQGILQRGLKSFFGVETAVIPDGHTQNVIFDPQQMWEETKGAWAAAGVMGAPGMVNNTANAIYESRNNAAPQATENAENANANPASDALLGESELITPTSSEAFDNKNTIGQDGTEYPKETREEVLHLKDQIRNNLDRINKTEAVSNVQSGMTFNVRKIQDAVNWITNKLGLPLSVKREGFGDVSITRKRINRGFDYLPKAKNETYRNQLGQAYTTALLAVPDVIARGVEIESHENHKGYGHSTKTFAGQVVLDGKPGIVAVVVKQTTGNFYDVHSVMTPDGELMVLDGDKKTEALTGGVSKTESVAPAMLSVDTTIPQSSPESNNNVDDGNNPPPSGPSSPGGTPAVDSDIDSDTIETRERGESRNIRTDEARDQQLRDFKEKNPDIYKVVKNNRTLRKALDIFDSQGVEGSAQALERALYDAQNGRKLPLEMVPLHKLVCDELSRQGQVERANRISSDLGAELTYAGQLGQANVILRSASPTAQADAFAKTVERLISENNADIDQESVDDLISRYRSADTQEARDAIVDDAMTAIAQSSPTTFREALNAIRYLNMLGNFKTQIRNVAGNTGMLVMARAKNRVLALEQMAWNAAFKNHQITQTNTLTTNPELFREAWRMFSEDRDAAVGEGKYSDVAQGNKAVRDKKTVFKWNWKSESDSALRKIADAPMKVLEAYRKATSWAMEEGDVIFQKVTYAQTLADYAKAQGYSSLQDIDPDTLQTMREYAIREAQEATFHDKNAVSEWFSGFDRDWDAKYGRVGKALKTVTQGVAPFRQTPANVGVRMEEYSPLGVVNTFVDAYSAIKGSGDVDANTVLNAAAKTLSGTGLAVLGYVLAKHGLARGKEDDKELEAYERNVQGLSDYSIVLPDGTSVSLDWFAPESASFFVGVAAADAFKDGAQADDIIALLGSTSDIAMNMSFLSGLQDSLDKLSSLNGDMGALPTFLLNSLISYGGQITTNSLLGQAEQASERYRQTSYSDKEGVLPTGLQYTASKLTSKMPGIDYNQADYIDAWGRKQDNGENVAGRVAESFFSPAYINDSRATEIDDELKRLHEATKDTVKGSVLPTVAARSTKVGDQTLTPEEYEIYQTRAGQTAYKLVSDFINGEGYDSMSDDDRAKVINDLYGFARDTAKNSVLLSRGEQTEKSDYDKARAIKDAGGMSWAQYYQTKEGRDMDGNGSAGAEETAQYLFENFPEDKAKKIFNAYYPDSKTPYEEYAGHAQEIKDAGFTKQEYDALTATVKEAKTGAESWDSKGDNAVIDAVVAAVGKGLSEDGATLLITENTSKYYSNPYSALIDSGRSMQESMDILNMIDAPGKKDGKEVPPDKAIQQAELKAYYKEHPEEEVVIALIWDSMGYTGKNTKDFETYKKTLK